MSETKYSLPELFMVAKEKYPYTGQLWYYRSEMPGTDVGVECTICDKYIGSYDINYAMPESFRNGIIAHLGEHLTEEGKDDLNTINIQAKSFEEAKKE
ncbi:MAG: hypothetical protein QXW57_04330 [Candidatus Micrarchaeaceae archaeon]